MKNSVFFFKIDVEKNDEATESRAEYNAEYAERRLSSQRKSEKGFIKKPKTWKKLNRRVR
jgi:hypothetical protein